MNKIAKITSFFLISALSISVGAEENNKDTTKDDKSVEKTQIQKSESSKNNQLEGLDLTMEDAKAQLKEHFPDQAEVSGIEKSPFDNIYYFRVDGQPMMFVESPKYLISGKLFNMTKEENMLNDYMASYYQEKLKVFDEKEFITFKPEERDVKFEVTVFTDPSCPYCTKMHKKIDEYTGYGIQVNYLPFPRGGKSGPGYQKLLKTWCAADEKRAEVLTAAKLGNNQELVNAQKVTNECRAEMNNMIQKSKSLGITGTPSVFLSTGHQVGGYLEPEVLLQKINENVNQ